MLAVLFPHTDGTQTFAETTVYYMEHYISAIVNPLYHLFNERYYEDFLGETKFGLLGSTIFVAYTRLVLTGISIITGANINFGLCPPKSNIIFNLRGSCG